MNYTCYASRLSRARRAARGFSLVEVTLAVAVVAIGLMGILALFPLGMDAVRQSADATQMQSIGQDTIAYYQQMAANSNYYSSVSSEVIPPTESYSSNLTVDGISYHVETVVANAGFRTITVNATNMISRVQIGVYRTSGPIAYTAIGNTNYYFTEVDRYVQ